MQTTVDRFGRIVIPKPIRDDLGLRPGATVDIEEENGTVRLVPVHDEPGLMVKEGVLVYGGKAAGDLDHALREAREDRLRDLDPRRRK